MALTKETILQKIDIVGEFKTISVRIDTVVKEDGKEISRTPHRHALTPDASQSIIDAQHDDVKSAINTYWTDDLKTKYTNQLAEQEAMAQKIKNGESL